jgi:hypothetical protein
LADGAGFAAEAGDAFGAAAGAFFLTRKPLLQRKFLILPIKREKKRKRKRNRRKSWRFFDEARWYH